MKPKAVSEAGASGKGDCSPRHSKDLEFLLSDPNESSALRIASMVMRNAENDAYKASASEILLKSLTSILYGNDEPEQLPPSLTNLVKHDSIDHNAVKRVLEQHMASLPSSHPILSHDYLVSCGKLGPPVVQIHRSSATGEIKFDSVSLTLASLSNFSSARANSCVFRGRWMYEVTLGTAGIQQLGWATLSCPFTNEEGVGDAPDSYAVDGKRVRKWNGGCAAYGQPWTAGDIIGCLIDLEAGTVSFSRNGVSLGLAFSSVRRLQPGLAYYPALSLSHGERCELNFGGRPFAHPVSGYLPLQAPPHVKTRPKGKVSSGDPIVDFLEDALEEFVGDPMEEEDEEEEGEGEGAEGEGVVCYTKKCPPYREASSQAEYLLACLGRLVRLQTSDPFAIPSSSSSSSSPPLLPLPEEDVIFLASTLCSLLGPLLVLGGPLKSSSSSSSSSSYRQSGGYLVWSSLLPFLLSLQAEADEAQNEAERAETGASRPPRALDLCLSLLLQWLEKPEVDGIFPSLMEALSYRVRTTSLLQGSGPEPYLALACRVVARRPALEAWWASRRFAVTLEGLLTRKAPNRVDLQEALPRPWWQGCREVEAGTEEGKEWGTRKETEGRVEQLAANVAKLESWHLCLCRSLLAFAPPRPSRRSSLSSSSPLSSAPHSNALTPFLHQLLHRNRGANRKMPPPGMSDNSVLVSAFFVLLRLLAEGPESEADMGVAGKLWEEEGGSGEAGVRKAESGREGGVEDAGGARGGRRGRGSTRPGGGLRRCGLGYLHAGGSRKFPVSFLLRSDSLYMNLPRLGGALSHVSKSQPMSFPEDYEDVVWEDSSCQEEQEAEGAGGEWEKGCQGPGGEGSSRTESVLGFGEGGQRAAEEAAEEVAEAAERDAVRATAVSVVAEEELVDMLVLLYHLGVAANFKQSSLSLQSQLQSIGQLEDVDRQIMSCEGRSDVTYVKSLQEARHLYRDDVLDNVRQCVWYRVTLFSQWKQEAIYAVCVWIVQLLLECSKRGKLFSYLPEFYVETLVDSFHALRRSDPPFAPPAALLQSGLSSLVTFLVTHFNDPRIANPDVKDVLLQSISVLLQYREYMEAFEANPVARARLPAALLAAFDKRFWIPVSHILLRLCKGSAFGGFKLSTSGMGLPQAVDVSSPVFQELLRVQCAANRELLDSFLNRLFNTLNWTLTQFSITVKEMSDPIDRRQISDLQLRKCDIMFELSCNLLRVLEFLCLHLPHAFTQSHGSGGGSMSLARLAELVVFVVSHTAAGPDAALFDRVQRLHGSSHEKLSREAIMGPIAGILVNLGAAMDAEGSGGGGEGGGEGKPWDLARALAQVDASTQGMANFDYLVTFNWAECTQDEESLARLPELKAVVERLKQEMGAVKSAARMEIEGSHDDEEQQDGDLCSICYACDVDTTLLPCKHQSCRRCVQRHLLDNSRCFFCNAVISELSPEVPEKAELGAPSNVVVEKSEQESE